MTFIRDTHLLYTVQPGDTLFSIANRFGSTMERIEQANFLYPPVTDRYLIYPGWKLLVPVGVDQTDKVYYVTPDGQSLWLPAFVYEIERGDTLYSISQKMNIAIESILYLNQARPGFSRDVLFIGFTLLIPLAASRNIIVTSPLPSESIRHGERVEGFARVFEGNVLIEVQDDQGVIVSHERFTTAVDGGPNVGYFSTSIPFDQQPTTKGGFVRVYSRSAEDGSIIDLVQVRVQFD